jgi:hypothetical protein
MRALLIPALMLGAFAPRVANADDLDDARIEPGFVLNVLGRIGAVAVGSAGTKYGAQGGGRLDVATVESGGIRAYALRAEVSAATAGSGAFGAQALSVDYAIIEGSSTLGNDAQRVVHPCLWLINAPCNSGGVAGVGLDLLAWQTSLTSNRRAFRLADVDFVSPIEPATDSGWSSRRVPVRVGISVDEIDGISGTSATWIPRLDLGADGLFRFANGEGELDARIRYRPSLSGFTADYGIEATVYIGYRTRHYLIQPQGAPLLIGVELGYAYWSLPAHSFGVSWNELASNTGFARLVVGITPWAIH